MSDQHEKQNLEHVTNKRGSRFSPSLKDSLLKQLEEKTEELSRAFENFEDRAEITKIYSEISKLKNKIDGSLSKYNIDTEFNFPRTEIDLFKLQIDRARYREPRNKTELTISEIIEEEETPLTNKPPVAKRKVILKPATLKINQEASPLSFKEENLSCLGSSTPLSSKIFDRKSNVIRWASTKKRIENTPLGRELLINSIKSRLELEVKKEIVDSYFEEEKNLEELNKSLDAGLNFNNVIEFFKGKLNLIIKGNQVENTESESESENSKFFSIVNSSTSENQSRKGEINHEGQVSNKSVKMTNPTLQIRGLSLKDALDLIPRFNGQNITLAQFLDGCEEAKSILPKDLESELSRLIRIRLYGDALNSARGQNFNNLQEVADFFENIFGSAKTYHEWSGELAKLKQKPNESVIVFLNRLREVEREIRAAAQREKRIKDTQVFESDLERDCVKYFLKGLRWEIRARMGTPESLKEAREQAIEIEREYSCTIPDDELKGKEDRPKYLKETKKVNLVESDTSKITCQFCNKTGHYALNCIELARSCMRGPDRNFSNNYHQRDTRNSGAGNANFGWNSENRRRPEFLPSNNRGNFYPPNINRNQQNFSRFGNNLRRPPDRPYNNNQNRFGERNYRPSITCSYCGKLGHTQQECFKKQRENNQPTVSQQGNAEALSRLGARGEGSTGTRPNTPSQIRNMNASSL